MFHFSLRSFRNSVFLFLFGFVFFVSSNALADSVVYSYSSSPSAAATSSSNANLPAASCSSTVGNSFGTVSAPVNTSSSSTSYSGATGGGNIGNAVAVSGNATFSSSTSAYISFTLTPNTGYAVSISAIAFGSRSTGTGPQGYTVSTSVGGFGTAVASGTLSNNSTWTYYTPTFSSVIGATSTPVEVRIYTYGGSGSASSGSENWRVDDITFTVSVAGSSTDFYSGPTGGLDTAGSWWTGSGGTSGTHPTNFSTAGQVFHISNGNTGVLGGNWAVSGSGSKIVVDGTDFTVPSTKSVTGTIDVNASRTLTLSNATLPTLGTLDPASTIKFLNQTAMTVPVVTYGNIVFDNSTVAIPGSNTALTFAGNFTLQNSASFVGANPTGISLTTTGSANQTINANGLTLTVRNIDVGTTNSKASGTVTLASSTNITVLNSLIMNLTGPSAQFIDGGNTLTVGNNIDLTGNASGYNLTGIIITNGTSGTQNFRGAGASTSPCVAAIGNLKQTSVPVQVCPTGGGSSLTIKGNLVIGASTTGALTLNANTLNIGGNFIDSMSTNNITTVSGSLVQFNGSSAQTYFTNVAAGVHCFHFFNALNQKYLPLFLPFFTPAKKTILIFAA